MRTLHIMTDALLARLLMPLARLFLLCGVPYGAAAEALKRAFVAEAARRAAATGGKATDSRLSVTTGLQRREIARLRDLPELPPARPDPLARLIARWRGGAPWAGPAGPHALPRTGPTPSFEALARSIRQDVHPRTFLDRLAEAGAVRVVDETVHLLANAWLPGPG
ncbi:MAG: DUF6502 family protein, partial [Pseudomonadota bacterium]